MDIVYKVVCSDERCSYNIDVSNKYCLYYYLNTIVHAFKNSLGIMCFDRKISAKKFVVDQILYSSRELEIIKVRPIGKATYPTLISAQVLGDCLDDFYKKDDTLVKMHPPEGTVCYDSIEVLT